MTTPPQPPTSFEKNNFIHAETSGDLKHVKQKFDTATNPVDRIGFGIQYRILALLEKESKVWALNDTHVYNRDLVEGLAQGCAYGAYNVLVQAAMSISKANGSDYMENLVQLIGGYMEQQSAFIQGIIVATTIPKDEKIQ